MPPLNVPIHLLKHSDKRLLLTQIGLMVRHLAPEQRIRVRCLSLIKFSCNLQGKVTLNDCMQAVQLYTLKDLLHYVSRNYIYYKTNLPPALDNVGLHLHSWNVTSLQSANNVVAQKKLAMIEAWLAKGPVCLQETKWTDVEATAYQFSISTCQVLHTPALLTDNGRSGGVAILLPTYLTNVAVDVQALVEHYALLVTIATRATAFHIINLYLPPGKEKSVLGKLTQSLQKLDLQGSVIMVGDINQARNLEVFQELLTAQELSEVTSEFDISLPTFTHKTGSSSLDTVCVSSSLLDITGWSAEVKSLLPLATYGHSPLHLNLRPNTKTARTTVTTLPSYTRLPPHTLDPKNPTTRALPHALLAHHSGLDHDTLHPQEVLEQMHAYLYAWCATFSRQKYTDLAFWVRRKEHEGKLFVTTPLTVLDALNHKLVTPFSFQHYHSQQEGTVQIPRRDFDKFICLLNDWECQSRELHNLQDLRNRLLGRQRSLKVWERFRALAPKNMHTLKRLRTDETFVTTPEELAIQVMQLSLIHI